MDEMAEVTDVRCTAVCAQLLTNAGVNADVTQDATGKSTDVTAVRNQPKSVDMLPACEFDVSRLVNRTLTAVLASSCPAMLLCQALLRCKR